jgi:hypothetical protein
MERGTSRQKFCRKHFFSKIQQNGYGGELKTLFKQIFSLKSFQPYLKLVTNDDFHLTMPNSFIFIQI